MPMYEYLCEEDGTRVTLMRPMRDADLPVEDPEGKNRRFVRALTAPMVAGKADGVSLTSGGGMCGCGKPHGSCGSR